MTWILEAGLEDDLEDAWRIAWSMEAGLRVDLEGQGLGGWFGG